MPGVIETGPLMVSDQEVDVIRQALTRLSDYTRQQLWAWLEVFDRAAQRGGCDTALEACTWAPPDVKVVLAQLAALHRGQRGGPALATQSAERSHGPNITELVGRACEPDSWVAKWVLVFILP